MPRPRTSASTVNKDDLPSNTPSDSEEDFDQGRGDGNQDDRPPTPEDVGVKEPDHSEPEEVARPKPARASTKEEPQTAFGDIIVNVEDNEGIALLKLLEVRSRHLKAAQTYGAACRDIKKNLVERGAFNGKATHIRVGEHLISLTDLTDSRHIDEFDRSGSQRMSVKHPE